MRSSPGTPDRSSSGSGLPRPGRFSNSPRAIAERIFDSAIRASASKGSRLAAGVLVELPLDPVDELEVQVEQLAEEVRDQQHVLLPVGELLGSRLDLAHPILELGDVLAQG